MERSLFRYIWKHTWRDQVWLLVVTLASFPLVYVNLEVPKRIVNDAIGGKHLPQTLFGIEITQVEYLMILSFALLALITINGAVKYWLNVYRGIVGERMVRRLRYQLYDAVLRFPLGHFRRTSAGETIPMITAETDPIGGFIGESIAQPAFQAGLLITYMTFIFVQNFWLGLAAVALYPPQAWLIPKLQRKINQLAKKRIQKTREFSDRIGDVIGGAAEIRANNAARYELADASARLGTIYAIRVDIYKRKFFVKFLNNFLAQITPFFFYAIGGYFAIQGQLSVGALVAVVAAYKDIIDPWKELLKWYETKEDVRVKYEQIIDQFEPEGMLPAEMIERAPTPVPRLGGPLVAQGVTYVEEGATVIEPFSVEVTPGERVAIVGAGDSAKSELALLLARLVIPTSGRLAVGPVSLVDAHIAIPGSRIGYASRNAHVFSGTLLHNLLYGLKHRPVREVQYEGPAASAEAQRRRDAEMSGNSTDDINAGWIDPENVGVDDAERHALEVLRVVLMDAELLAFGLASRGAAGADERLVGLVLEARARLRDKVRSPELAPLIELFDRERYIENASVAENLLFGTPTDPAFAFDRLPSNPEVRKLLDDTGLAGDLEAAGIRVARLMIELFADEPEDSPLFAEYSFISPEDLGDFRDVLRRLDERGSAALGPAQRTMLLSLPLKIVAARHRLDIPNAEMRSKLVAARQEFHNRFADRNVVAFLDPDRFSPALSIRDNILLGRPVYEQARAQERLTDLVREIALEIGMEAPLIRRGLEFDVGPSGARLAYPQKQRLAIARALLKNPDILVFDEPTSGLDPTLEREVIRRVLEWAGPRTVLWSLGQPQLAQQFPRVLVFDRGRLVEDGTFDALVSGGSVLPRLVA
ncbi:MAG TPA: ABC transporter transmembrane domain-containing protein [Casimicrobiaceae bacterium]|nr:ABC transporter transmembrane domain-containing protein [Casimicrobiaceae bacterium]